MPYDEEEPPYVEPDREVDEWVRFAIDAAFEVYRETGPGLDEAIYEAAMCRELELRGVPFQKQVTYAVQYKGTEIGSRRVDLGIFRANAGMAKCKTRSKEGIKRVVNPRGR